MSGSMVEVLQDRGDYLERVGCLETHDDDFGGTCDAVWGTRQAAQAAADREGGRRSKYRYNVVEVL